MKWRSIKEYIPPTCTELFIRAININVEMGAYHRYFIGMIEDLNFITELNKWEMLNGIDLDFINPNHYEVTHFAIPDAVEI